VLSAYDAILFLDNTGEGGRRFRSHTFNVTKTHMLDT
jgi:hypothetical protein